jgi:predicted GIY-YIG superfamily endonuclease
VYILKLVNNTYYVGQTADLKRRLKDHKGGNTSHTRKFRPVDLVYYCAFKDKKRALAFEKYLKSGSGKAFKKKRLV